MTRSTALVVVGCVPTAVVVWVLWRVDTPSWALWVILAMLPIYGCCCCLDGKWREEEDWKRSVKIARSTLTRAQADEDMRTAGEIPMSDAEIERIVRHAVESDGGPSPRQRMLMIVREVAKCGFDYPSQTGGESICFFCPNEREDGHAPDCPGRLAQSLVVVSPRKR